uniref:Uncharacterized protein n=1 Tax=Magallana gigas TaxID=29159 RepID=K1QHT6_MAGGI
MTVVTVNNGGRYPAVLITIIVISRKRAMWIAKSMAVGAIGVSSLSVPRRVGEGSRPGSGLAPIPHPDMAD